VRLLPVQVSREPRESPAEASTAPSATPEGMSFLYKRLNDAKFVWPQVRDGTVCLSAAQLSMLLEGIDWRHPKRTGLSPEDPDRARPTRT